MKANSARRRPVQPAAAHRGTEKTNSNTENPGTEARPSASSSVIPGNVWKCIWHLKTPPKDEFVEHMLLLCPWVEPIWFGGPLNYRVNRANISNFPAWVLSFIGSDLGSKDEIARILMNVAFTCWFIWKTRCSFVYDNRGIYPNQVIMSISNSVNGFLEASVASEGHPQRNLSRPGPPACWGPPGHPFLKVNVDASWEASSKSGFAGVVIRYHAGKFVAARRGMVGATNVAAAEAAAILLGCELAKALALECIIVESDSKENILCLAQGCSRGSWEAFPVISKALRLGGLFQDCRWSWVPRSANLAAHVLASRSIPEMCDVNWVNFPPSSLVHVLNKDGLPCPH
ncbi:uncharacterized protein LOC103936570 [Pyrus x bretschneideri]|uniref:uncharacterized protein LOC103936570 n=1 Tax=Pyrus x bretschneideri TaxID=225117 RepID=UPI00202FF484|nr:uncharacterized protein LOC103936570 [Pyrus x bretschneideri]